MSVFSIFKNGLQKTTTAVSRAFSSLVTGEKAWSEENFEDLEALLISADFGVSASRKIVDDIRDRYKRGLIQTSDDIRGIARADIIEIMCRNNRPVNLAPPGKPTVILMVGVNGSGKTTTTGKLAWIFQNQGKKVILGACDTFRAAAVDQLKLWGERTGAQVIAAAPNADPSSVAFDATKAALARQADYLIIDTAGRQQNRKGLMDELGKIRRTIDKVYPGAPQEVWLTVDASLGGNAVSQAREFSKVSGLTGLVLTKLDGSGKGGMAVALHQEFGFNVYYIGLGERPEDLQVFDPEFYAAALFDE